MVNILKNNLFVFWESQEKMPGYLDACQDTWRKNIKNLEIHIINYGNIKDYIGDVYDVELLKKISLPKQSDAISVAVLEKFGGLFIDMDTLITKDIFNFFNKFDPDKLIFFGYPPDRGVHVAVMYAGASLNPILIEWRKQCQYKLENLNEDVSWSSFGNSIIDPMLKNENYKNFYHIIDCVASGNILERCLNMLDARKQYEAFYFSPKLKIDVRQYIEGARDGIISLHNSWTPVEYKSMEKKDFLINQCPLAEIINSILKKEDYEYIDALSGALYWKFSKNKFFLKNRTIKNKALAVIDFNVNGCLFGFDLKKVFEKDEDQISIEIVARNEGAKNKLTDLFNFNKSVNKWMLEKCDESSCFSVIEKIINDISRI